jgi:hypothetical protein
MTIFFWLLYTHKHFMLLLLVVSLFHYTGACQENHMAANVYVMKHGYKWAGIS